MFRNRKFGLLIVCAAAWALTSSAFAVEVVHFDMDFTDGDTSDGVGTLNNVDAALAIRTQNAWRNPGQTYFGVAQSEAFDDAGGFGTAKQFRMTMANGGTLLAGNVWVLDMSIISDMATTGSQFFSGAPGPVVEWDWLTPLDFSFASSSVSKLAPAISSVGGDSGSVLAAAYPNGADGNVEPTALGTSLSDAGLATALNNVLRAKYVYQSMNVGTVSGFTRASTQVLNGGTIVGSAGHNDGGAGTFRSDYSGGLFAQVMGGHGGGNVTYAAGHGGGTDVAFNAATHENLELGLTKLTFKQVSQADNTTDGDVDLDDLSNTIGNFTGSKTNATHDLGKNFFQGDTDADADVDLTDFSNVVGAWTAAVAGAPLEEEGKAAAVALGTGAAYYDPSNGHILLDVNGVALWRLDSATGQFTGQPTDLDPSAGVRWTVPGTTKQADAFTIGEGMGANGIVFANEFNFGTFQFDYTGVPGDIGQLLDAGLTSLDGLTFSYQTLGNSLVTVQLQVIPEPATVGLVALALGGLVTRLRRRSV